MKTKRQQIRRKRNAKNVFSFFCRRIDCTMIQITTAREGE